MLVAMGIDRNARVYVAGHRGLVGSAIWRELERQGFKQLIGRTRREVNLLDAEEGGASDYRPEVVRVAHAVKNEDPFA